MASVLTLSGITKRFPGVVANDGIDFELAEGEIHALLGENGAGKTTLMDIIYGLLRPDEGEIRVRGEICHFHAPLDAISRGIGMVHQHFMLVPTLTVAMNIMLGQEPTRGPFLAPEEAVRRIAQVSHEYGIDVHPSHEVSQLSVGEQQRVEILRLLYRGADILILDEPTAVITPPEAEALFCTLASMRRLGKSVIFITHKLKEVMALSDRVTVLRRGRVVDTVNTRETNERQLAQMMVGRDVVLSVTRASEGQPSGPVLAELRDLQVQGDRGNMAVKGIDLALHANEILGVAGVDGNGQSELAEALAGLRHPAAGQILIRSSDVSRRDPLWLAGCGVHYIPADRNSRGAVPSLSVANNAVLKNHRDRPFSRWGILNHTAIRGFAQQLVADNDVRCPSVDIPAGTLSGGNLQKLILGRETAQRPDILIAEHPTRGLDVSATEDVRRQLLGLANAGTAVLLISADLEELLALSDRIVVMHDGRLTYQAARAQVDMDQLGLAMAGLSQGGGAECTEL
jgi:general nucleoside transport system ATP-binding protein